MTFGAFSLCSHPEKLCDEYLWESGLAQMLRPNSVAIWTGRFHWGKTLEFFYNRMAIMRGENRTELLVTPRNDQIAEQMWDLPSPG